jgi:hypothetical protein
MRLRSPLFCVSLAALTAFATLNACADSTSDGISLGKTLVGPEMPKSKFEGQVVVFEYWGIN